MKHIAIGLLILGLAVVDGSAVYAAPSEAAMTTAIKFDLPLNRVDNIVATAPYAKLSADVYRRGITKGDIVNGWVVVDDVRKSYDDYGEFHATAYKRGGEVVVVFEGTRAFVNTISDISTGIDILAESGKENITSGVRTINNRVGDGLSEYGKNVIGGTKELTDDSKKVWEMLKRKDFDGALNIIKGTGKDAVDGGNIMARDFSGETKVAVKVAANAAIDWLQQYGKAVAGGAQEFSKDVLQNYDAIGDWVTNTVGSPLISPQDMQASMFTSKIVANYPSEEITVAGHSLGGRLAQFSLLMNEGVSSNYIFNSAPLSMGGVFGGTVDERGRLLARTISIRTKNDPLGVVDKLAFINQEREITVFDLGHSIVDLAEILAKVSDFYLAYVSGTGRGGRGDIATALIIDRSGSMIGLKSGPSGTAVSRDNKYDKKKLEKAKEAAKAFILSREENDMVSLSVFSDSASTVQGITAVNTIKPQIDGILGKIKAAGATNIGAGLEQGFMQLSNTGDTYTKMVVLLSDGENNRGEWQTKVDKFKQKGWPVCTVGFGSDADETTLRAIAKNTGCIYEFSDISNIVNTFQGINAYASGESTILLTNDALPPQGSISYPFYVTALAKILKIYTSWQGSTLNTVLTSPDGRKIDKQYVVQGSGRYEEGDTFQMLELKNPQLGKWTIEVGWAVPPLVTERVNLIITEKTDIFVRIHGFRPQYSISEPVVINVDAQELVGSDRKIPLTNLKLDIQVQKPGPEMIRIVKARSSNWTMYKDVMLDVTRNITLIDDGNHDDYKKGDGIFGGTFTETDTNGAYLVTVNITGQKRNGESVEKTLIGVFQIGPITSNQITTGQTLQFMEQADIHINNSTPLSKEIIQQPLYEIDKIQTDPMDSIDRLLN